MKLSTPRYSFCLFFQLIFVICDIIFNCVSLFPRSRDSLLVIFIFQDLLLVLSITSMLMTLFSTYLFQAGLVSVLVREFRAAGGVCGLYAGSALALTAARGARGAGGAGGWRGDGDGGHSPALVALFTLHRCLSPWYYFTYKRAALRVADPRLHGDGDWAPRP